VEFDILSGYNPLPADFKPVPAPLKDKAQIVNAPAQKNKTQPETANRSKPSKSPASKTPGLKPAAGVKPTVPASGQKPSADIKPTAAGSSTKASKPAANGGVR
jgi:hypothetical protein